MIFGVHQLHYQGKPIIDFDGILYHFKLFSSHRSWTPKSVCCHGSHWHWPAMTANTRPKYCQILNFQCAKNVSRSFCVMRPTGLCRCKILAWWSWVTGHTEQFKTVQYLLYQWLPSNSAVQDRLLMSKNPVKTRLLELQSMGRVLGFGGLECWTYGHRGQRRGLNLCVLPLLLEPGFVFVFWGSE